MTITITIALELLLNANPTPDPKTDKPDCYCYCDPLILCDCCPCNHSLQSIQAEQFLQVIKDFASGEERTAWNLSGSDKIAIHISEQCKEKGEVRLKIYGGVDSDPLSRSITIEKFESNFGLSQARAEFVKQKIMHWKHNTKVPETKEILKNCKVEFLLIPTGATSGISKVPSLLYSDRKVEVYSF